MPEDPEHSPFRLFKHHLLVQGLSLKNVDRILQSNGKKRVDVARNTRNNHKSPRIALKDSLPLLEPAFMLARMFFLVQSTPVQADGPQVPSIEY
ncbi:hypothetical protein PG994_004052 [Apiospora phragmitis]|uniref:Uncharacterized protein n=1 Tax=Apiospora phragmitis TaxID=2905665 RepID=A0ABR1VZX1_9PEZI